MEDLEFHNVKKARGQPTSGQRKDFLWIYSAEPAVAQLVAQ